MINEQRVGVARAFLHHSETGRVFPKGFSINMAPTEPGVFGGGLRSSSNPCGSILQGGERFLGRFVFGVGVKFRETYLWVPRVQENTPDSSPLLV